MQATLRLVIAAAGAVTLSGTILEPGMTARQTGSAVPLDVFARAAAADDRVAREALEIIDAGWRPGYASILLELAGLSRPATITPPPQIDAARADAPDRGDPFEELERAAAAPQRSPIRDRLLQFLARKTRQRFGDDFERWHQWIWSLPYEPHPDYALFKGLLYANIDPRMREFFPPGVPSLIRLDEVEWGGVPVNGIPPLYYPKVVPAASAEYLRDNHIVFGLVVDGEARAYPKRILAWHELAWDQVGGVELTIVYCTLCGTVIPYDSVVGGQRRRLGTSGLLYRSNKLMFDEETRSLWSTLEGKPVVGPLVGSDLVLTARAIVTTTWGEWRRDHPGTTVLSLDTGHERDYSEGEAYRDYFRTDRLMFFVPTNDKRLKNKDEVLVLRLRPAEGGDEVPLAIAADFLRRRPVFQTEVAGRQIVVLTSRNGANRVYDAGDTRFAEAPGGAGVIDRSGTRWTVGEDALVSQGTPVVRRPRLAAQRAFWFGWHAQFPGTLLIK